MTTHSYAVTFDDSDIIALTALLEIYLQHSDNEVFKSHWLYKPTLGAAKNVLEKISETEPVMMSCYTP